MPVDRNPLGKIPALERPDGPTLYDSRVITRYLDDILHARLYPAAPHLWDTLVIEATGDGIAEAAVLMRYELHVRPNPSALPTGPTHNGRRSPAPRPRWRSAG
jgi:glutathione S-transferase